MLSYEIFYIVPDSNDIYFVIINLFVLLIIFYVICYLVVKLMEKAETICKKVCYFENKNYSKRDRKIDKILTSKTFGFPIMILFLGIIKVVKRKN